MELDKSLPRLKITQKIKLPKLEKFIILDLLKWEIYQKVFVVLKLHYHNQIKSLSLRSKISSIIEISLFWFFF